MRLTLLTILILSFLQGCTANIRENELAENTPQTRITRYSNALYNLGDMMYSSNKKLYISVEPIENKTAATGVLPADIQLMVETALNSVGQIEVVPYSSAAINEHNRKGHKVLIVHGGITEFDSELKTHSKGGNAGFYLPKIDIDGEFSKTVQNSISSITLSFTFLKLDRSSYISGLQINNQMQIEKQSSDTDFGFSIKGNGIGINAVSTRKDGVHAILKLLVDLSMVELVGRYADLPYWTIIGSTPSVAMLKKIKNDFKRASKREKVKKIQQLLSREYNLKIDGLLGRETKEMILKAKKQLGLTDKALISSKFFHALLVHQSQRFNQDYQ